MQAEINRAMFSDPPRTLISQLEELRDTFLRRAPREATEFSWVLSPATHSRLRGEVARLSFAIDPFGDPWMFLGARVRVEPHCPDDRVFLMPEDPAQGGSEMFIDASEQFANRHSRPDREPVPANLGPRTSNIPLEPGAADLQARIRADVEQARKAQAGA